MQNIVNMQMEAMRLQTEMMNNAAQTPQHPKLADASSNTLRQVKVPEGHYNMSLSEFRTYRKDCLDYRTLTGYTNKQIVLQMRLNMDQDLKRAIDTNFGPSWDEFTVDAAIKVIQSIVNQMSNPAVYMKGFDNMNQSTDESIRAYVTRLKSCAIDCNFVCPHDEMHDLSDYNIVNRIRSGLLNKTLQQEVLQKSEELNNITNLVHFCENFEATKKDRHRLAYPNNKIDISCIDKDNELSQEEIIAAISSYKKSKKVKQMKIKPVGGNLKCSYCGYFGSNRHNYSNCPAQHHGQKSI